jgi:hypothetical protein
MPFVVQETNNYQPSSTTNTLAWPSTPTAGNLLFVMYGANGSLLPTVADSGGAGSFTQNNFRIQNSLVCAMYSKTATGTEASVVATTSSAAFSMMAILELDGSRITAYKSRGVATPTAPTLVGGGTPWLRWGVTHFNTGGTASNGGIGFIVQNGSATIDAALAPYVVGDETYYTGNSAASLSIGYYSVDLYTSATTYNRFMKTTTSSSAICFGNVFSGPAPSSGIQALRRRREQP